MAVQNIQMNVKTAAGYDQLNPLTSASNVSYTNTVSGLVATNAQAAIDEVAARGGVVVSATLLASGWVGAQAPYTQTIAVQGVKESSGLIVVGFNPTTDLALQYMGEQANIICTGRATNSLTFTAYGALPTSDIGITVSIIIGDLGLINTFQSSEQWDCAWATETITTSQTWTVPTDVTQIEVRLFGGGGAGRASGGGGGHMVYGKFTVTPGAQYAVMIGAGGAFNSNAGLNDTQPSGGVSQFGDLLKAAGGSGSHAGVGGNGGTGGGGCNTAWSSGYYGGSASYGGAGGVAETGQTAGAYGGVAGRPGMFGDSGRVYLNRILQPSGEGKYGGGGGYNANGGDFERPTDATSYVAGGGGGGWDGGSGGKGWASSGSSTGGGGGGYGSEQIAPNAPYSGVGYGAGGSNGSGAPGICIIKYRKAVVA